MKKNTAHGHGVVPDADAAQRRRKSRVWFSKTVARSASGRVGLQLPAKLLTLGSFTAMSGVPMPLVVSQFQKSCRLFRLGLVGGATTISMEKLIYNRERGEKVVGNHKPDIHNGGCA